MSTVGPHDRPRVCTYAADVQMRGTTRSEPPGDAGSREQGWHIYTAIFDGPRSAIYVDGTVFFGNNRVVYSGEHHLSISVVARLPPSIAPKCVTLRLLRADNTAVDGALGGALLAANVGGRITHRVL